MNADSDLKIKGLKTFQRLTAKVNALLHGTPSSSVFICGLIAVFRICGLIAVFRMKLVDQKIGFVGLGNMGAPMARHLHAAGAEVTVWNRSEPALLKAEKMGLRRAETLRDLARALSGGIIGINLTTTETVAEVVFGKNGLVDDSLAPGTLIIDFGTTGVTQTKTFAARLGALGCGWVDAPVSGGQVGAEAASLTIMVGGAEKDVQRAWSIFEVVGKKITHLGDSGAGQVTKLANQLIVAQTIDAVAQALRLAELAGVDAAKVREALRGGFAESRILDLHGDRMIRRDFAPGGRSTLQLKDVRLICELAAEVGLDSPTLQNSLHQWVKFVEEKGWGDFDHSGLFKLYE
jgi:2-hydroxy-3-oxopropionate reductase